MQIKFDPNFTITPKMAGFLLRIEAAKEKVLHLPMSPSVLATLRETARLYTTHYSTMIEGNRLEPDQIEQVLKQEERFAGKERDEKEVKGYYAALRHVEGAAKGKAPITEKLVQTLHALVMSNGKTRMKPTPYRDGQNVIRDSRTKTIVYMPPEAKDVPVLMKGLFQWLAHRSDIPCPILAGIAHYQLATIHPYYDGNGRTARLLTTLILHLGGYDLKGLYSLEEYYAESLGAYYEALTVGPSHNYYRGRAEADITKWVEYFIEGMAQSFENVLSQMAAAKRMGMGDQTELLRQLDPRQRHVLELFCTSEVITAAQVAKILKLHVRTSAALCRKWAESGFLETVNFSNKARSYRLGKRYEQVHKFV